ncbi:alpha/beta hydrolase fold domain-containing protein [[Pseudomonas] boreopolis]|uniref:alpha/beta hydrolase fold domain-containing protein n=1 Tax=Xanthomonas boreopolis TaxID=86183 RepID=UPI003DA012A1
MSRDDDPALARIDPVLRVPMLPRARPLDLDHRHLARWMFRLVAFLSARGQPRPVTAVRRRRYRLASGDGTPLALRLHRPCHATGRRLPVLLWLHGGGYVLGSATADDRLCARLAAAAGIAVAALDYRLAPEHPCPLALQDGHAALVWLQVQADALGLDAARFAVGGASAGGGLAAALAQWAHDRPGPKPVFQLLLYPMLDDRTESPPQPHQGEWIWGADSNRAGWAAYLGDLPRAQAPVPARRDDLAGLPPAWIGCGMLDLFHAEDRVYAERLRAAGVPCEWVEVAGAYHGFDISAARAAPSLDWFERQVCALRRVLHEA